MSCVCTRDPQGKPDARPEQTVRHRKVKDAGFSQSKDNLGLCCSYGECITERGAQAIDAPRSIL